MLREYIKAAMSKAVYDILEDKTYYGEIPDFKGLFANESNLEECRNELEDTLEDWILLSISKHLPLPVVDGIELKVEETADA
ncbi:MAG: type II toxin-antitoxin system HicB family antitoxin [Ignavibacteria bacterium]